MVLISLFGFLSGAVFAGATVYYYILGEYRVSNEMLTEDIYVRFYIFTPSHLLFSLSYTGLTLTRLYNQQPRSSRLTFPSWNHG